MSGQKIVVIGGGFGGVAAARAARTLLDREHTVVLIDRNSRTHLCGSLPLLIVGERESAKISRSLGSLANRGIQHLQTEVYSINVEAKTLETGAGTLEYDYLVLAPGAEYDWNAVPGAARAYSFYDLKTAQRLRRKLSTFRNGRIIVAIAGLPYKCPPAPFEATMLLDWALNKRGVRHNTDLHVFTPEPMPLAVAGHDAGMRLRRALERKGIQLHTNMTVTEVADNGRMAAFNDKSSMDANIVITVPTHRAPSIVSSAKIGGEAGWIDVSPKTLETRVPGVYAVGDVATIPMGNGRPLPKAGVFASSEGSTAGHNIAAAINSSEPASFPGAGYCFIAYSATQAGVVRGDFLAKGAPNVRFQPAGSRGHQAKVRFEQDWRRFRI